MFAHANRLPLFDVDMHNASIFNYFFSKSSQIMLDMKGNILALLLVVPCFRCSVRRLQAVDITCLQFVAVLARNFDPQTTILVPSKIDISEVCYLLSDATREIRMHLFSPIYTGNTVFSVSRSKFLLNRQGVIRTIHLKKCS